MIGVLKTLDKWIDEIPPIQQPMRYGNKAFRTWHKKVKEVCIERKKQIARQMTAAAVACCRMRGACSRRFCPPTSRRRRSSSASICSSRSATQRASTVRTASLFLLVVCGSIQLCDAADGTGHELAFVALLYCAVRLAAIVVNLSLLQTHLSLLVLCLHSKIPSHAGQDRLLQPERRHGARAARLCAVHCADASRAADLSARAGRLSRRVESRRLSGFFLLRGACGTKSSKTLLTLLARSISIHKQQNSFCRFTLARRSCARTK